MIVRCYGCADTVLTRSETHYVRLEDSEVLCTTCGKEDRTALLKEPDYEEVDHVSDK